jgi:hypothetical protein
MKGMLNEDANVLERYAVSIGNMLTSSAQSLVLGPMIVKIKAVMFLRNVGYYSAIDYATSQKTCI